MHCHYWNIWTYLWTYVIKWVNVSKCVVYHIHYGWFISRVFGWKETIGFMQLPSPPLSLSFHSFICLTFHFTWFCNMSWFEVGLHFSLVFLLFLLLNGSIHNLCVTFKTTVRRGMRVAIIFERFSNGNYFIEFHTNFETYHVAHYQIHVFYEYFMHFFVIFFCFKFFYLNTFSIAPFSSETYWS